MRELSSYFGRCFPGGTGTPRLRLMEDGLSSDARLDSEGRSVLLLEAAARYIADEWDIKALLAESSP